MAFPSPATYASLDSSGDDPKLARAELLALAQKFNQLLTEVQLSTGQQAYDMAHPLHSILIQDWNTEPQLPAGITAIWTAIGAGKVLMTVDSGAGGPGGSATATTGSSGTHDHGGSTGGQALTTAQLPAHKHFVMKDTAGNPEGPSVTAGNYLGWENSASANRAYIAAGVAGEANVGKSSETGSGSTHSHTISTGGNHSHTVDISDPPHFKVRCWRRTA